VLLVHGFASSAEHNWRRPGWIDLLADLGRETIAVDLPGHGRAPRPASPAVYASVVANVAAAIGDRELVDAIGFSAGAHVLLRLVTLRGVDHFGTPADVRCMQAVLDFLGG